MNKLKMKFVFSLALIGLLVMILIFTVILKNALNKRSQQLLSFEAQPANQELTAEVLKTTAIRDSLFVTHAQGNSYKLYVLFDAKVSFAPIGVQILDQNSNTPLRTAQLNIRQQSELDCIQSNDINGIQGKLIYETEDIYLIDHQLPDYNEKRYITLFIKTSEGVFAVERLQVQDSCLWLTE